MTLYIANTTKQNWNHHFRIPETARSYYVRIGSGTQVEVGKDWGIAQTDAVVRQLEKFGARPASSVSGKLENFPGIFYSSGEAIKEDAIIAGHDAVVGGQEKRSGVESVRAALGYDASTRDRRTRKRLASVTEVEVKQEIGRNEQPRGNEVSMSIVVSESGDANAKLPGITD